MVRQEDEVAGRGATAGFLAGEGHRCRGPSATAATDHRDVEARCSLGEAADQRIDGALLRGEVDLLCLLI